MRPSLMKYFEFPQPRLDGVFKWTVQAAARKLENAQLPHCDSPCQSMPFPSSSTGREHPLLLHVIRKFSGSDDGETFNMAKQVRNDKTHQQAGRNVQLDLAFRIKLFRAPQV